MKHGYTEREFEIFKFRDRNGEKCSLQKSSIATEDCIWLGVTDTWPRMIVADGEGWRDVPKPLPETPGFDGVTYLNGTRMHLNREQAADLINLLQDFVDTGEIGTRAAAAKRDAPGFKSLHGIGLRCWENQRPRLDVTMQDGYAICTKLDADGARELAEHLRNCAAWMSWRDAQLRAREVTQ